MPENFKVYEGASEELQLLALDLYKEASKDVVQLLPAHDESLTEHIEVMFFQRYLRTKKQTEPTKELYQSLKMKTVLQPVKTSLNKEMSELTGTDIYDRYIEVSEPEKDEEGKFKFRMKRASHVVEIKKFPFGQMWKVSTYYKKEEADNLNKIIGRAARQLREIWKMTNNKGANLSQPLYCAIPLADGLTISNFQLYGTNNRQKGLQAKNLTSKGNEGDFARATIDQLKTVVERMQGNELEIAKDWKELTMQFPDIKSLKRKVK